MVIGRIERLWKRSIICLTVMRLTSTFLMISHQLFACWLIIFIWLINHRKKLLLCHRDVLLRFGDDWLEIGDEVFDCYISIINYCYVIYNNIWSAYEQKMEKNEFGFDWWLILLLDFNRSELQSLVRVVTLICKDRHEETILEGLKCLRVLSWILLLSIDYFQW